MRSVANLPAYEFDQELVVALLNPQPLLNIEQGIADQTNCAANVPGEKPAISYELADSDSTQTETTHAPFRFDPGSSNSTIASARAKDQHESTSDDFFIVETAGIRWKDPCAKPKPDDNAKAVDAVVQYRCFDCNDSNLLTKAELDKHKIGHAHTVTCGDSRCTRRFCAKRKKRRNEEMRCGAHLFGGDVYAEGLL
jgi:hypothetical protein